MSILMIALCAAAGLGIAGLAPAQVHAPKAPSSPIDARAACENTSTARECARAARAQARQLAVEKETEARMETNDDKRDAEYSLAVERCGSVAGAAKDACLGNAKLRYGRS